MHKQWTIAPVLFLLACTAEPQVSDSSMYLTGTEEAAVMSSNGQPSCDGKKVLICHFPPGNPDNAHSICVGKPAVDPHVRLHGDHVGACEGSPPPPVPTPDAAPPPPPPPPTCVPVGQSCTSSSVCCDSTQCGGEPATCQAVIP